MSKNASLETQQTKPRGVGCTALVRHCDRCLAVTAFDLDNTPANAKALKLQGQTVRVMDADEVKGMKLERCKCTARHEGLRCHVCNNTNPRCPSCGGPGTPWLI